MNYNRDSHREDALFVIALLVPAILSATRYFETERQITQIARAHGATTDVAAYRPVGPLSSR